MKEKKRAKFFSQICIAQITYVSILRIYQYFLPFEKLSLKYRYLNYVTIRSAIFFSNMKTLNSFFSRRYQVCQKPVFYCTAACWLHLQAGSLASLSPHDTSSGTHNKQLSHSVLLTFLLITNLLIDS